METLTAFVRERARWKEPDTGVMESMARYDKSVEEQDARSKRREPPTDIAAVLTVLKRRGAVNREREEEMGWRFDLRSTDLRGADLGEAHLEATEIIGDV
jgi:hypothetical protein